MSNENEEIIAAFIAEANENLADIENDFLIIEAGGADIDGDLVNRVFRAIHSMKGTAGYLGLKSIGSLAHEMENVLNLIRNRELVPTSPIIDALLRGADALREMVNDVESSNDVDVSDLVQALQASMSKTDDAAARAEPEEIPEREVDITLPDGSLAFMMMSLRTLVGHQREGRHIYVIEADLFADVHAREETPTGFLSRLQEHGERIDSYVSIGQVRGLAEELPDALTLMLLVASAAEREALATAVGVPTERVHLIATREQSGWGEEPPAPAQPAPSSTPDDANPTEGDAQPTAKADAQPSPQPAAPQAETDGDKTAPAKTPSTPRPDASLRVNVTVIDSLMNLAGELVLGRNQLLQVISTQDQEGLDRVAARLDQVTSELQEAIMQTRMQPVGTVFNKFPRVVRDLSGSLGKQCELTIRGKEVELDKTIIEAIGDPLTHLIRNSVDHGVETPDVRQANGKPPAGEVELRAFHQAGKVNITIRDDGKGIDAEKLKQSAIHKGIISAEQARDMSRNEAIRLIFHPGFSTAEKVTDVSGRGVGMDVVRTNIEKLGGAISVDTEVGLGTTFHIKLPLTLAIIPSLIVRCGEDRFAIPQVSISELVRIKPSEVAQKVERVKDAEVLRLRGSLLPLVRLSDALKTVPMFFDPTTGTFRPDRRSSVRDRRQDTGILSGLAQDDPAVSERRACNVASAVNVIVVETGHLRYGLIVDGLFDSQEIVVKPLGRHMKDIAVLAGATILGDGRVAPILDVSGIASHMQLNAPESRTLSRADEHGTDDQQELQAILLFTNAPDEYFGVPTGLISRIERVRADQIDAIGGQEVLQYRGASLPLLSLDKHIKARPRAQVDQCYVVVFRLAKQDVGLVVPDLVDIREVPTNLDTTTFREPGVIGSLVLEGKTTRLIDLFELAASAHPEWAEGLQRQQATEGPATRVLLAEDSSFFRTNLESFLKADGFAVTACEDGLEAWNALQEPGRIFDLVLTDIEMPNMDGYELTRKIRASESHKDLPIIAVTSLAADEDRQKGYKAGVDDYQIKLDREQLKQSITQVLKTRGASVPPVHSVATEAGS